MEDVGLFGSTGNPPVRNGASWLDFGTAESDGVETQTVWRVSKFTQAPFYRWGFAGWELRGDPTTDFVPLGPLDLPSYGIDQAAQGNEPPHHLFARYRSSHAFWTWPLGTDHHPLWTQHEVLLFTRDPEEQFQFFANLIKPSDFQDPLAFRDRWRAQITASLVPHALTLWYPPNDVWPTNLPVYTSEILAVDFWGANVVPMGPGAAPDHGSVKSAVVLNHGICSQWTPFGGNEGLFQALDDRLFSQLARRVLASYPCAEVIKRFSNFISFIRLPLAAEEGQAGGFITNASVQLNVIFGGGPNVLVQDAFWFRLLDGRLTVEPLPLFETGAGTGSGPARVDLANVVTRSSSQGNLRPYDSPVTLAENFWQQADSRQSYRGISPIPFTCANASLDTTFGPGAECKKDPNGNAILGPSGCVPGFECAGSPPKCRNIDSVPVDDKLADCGGFVSVVDGQATAAAQAVAGLADFKFSQEDIAEIQRTVLEATFDPRWNRLVYKHFRCVARRRDPMNPARIDARNPDYDETATPVCEYVLPAKRVNVLPDGVELVFIDDTREFKNPAFPIWLTLWAPARGNPDTLSPLCDPPTATGPGEKRSRAFAFLNGPGRYFACPNPDSGQCAHPCSTTPMENPWP